MSNTPRPFSSHTYTHTLYTGYVNRSHITDVVQGDTYTYRIKRHKIMHLAALLYTNTHSGVRPKKDGEENEKGLIQNE